MRPPPPAASLTSRPQVVLDLTPKPHDHAPASAALLEAGPRSVGGDGVPPYNVVGGREEGGVTEDVLLEGETAVEVQAAGQDGANHFSGISLRAPTLAEVSVCPRF